MMPEIYKILHCIPNYLHSHQLFSMVFYAGSRIWRQESYSVSENYQYTSLSVPVLAQLQNLEWGGNWIKFKDFPHYQLTAVSEDVAKVRGLFEAGSAYA